MSVFDGKTEEELRAWAEAASYEDLLYAWRFEPAGSPLFAGETGKYVGQRMAALRAADPSGHVRASKSIGW